MSLVPMIFGAITLFGVATGSPIPSAPESQPETSGNENGADKPSYGKFADKGLYLGLNTAKLGGAAALFLVTLIGVERLTRWAFASTKDAIKWWSSELIEIKTKPLDPDMEDLGNESDGWESPLIERRHMLEARDVRWMEDKG